MAFNLPTRSRNTPSALKPVDVRAELEGDDLEKENPEHEQNAIHAVDENLHDPKRDEGEALQKKWKSFSDSLRSVSRFFNPAANDVLYEIFHDLADHQTEDGQPVIIDAGPRSSIAKLHRARVFHERGDLLRALRNPEISVGPPPAGISTAGRMNATGIPVFYGAIHEHTALAEVRPPVGSRVVVAEFEIVRPLRLLDVEALRSIAGKEMMSESDLSNRKDKAGFLRGLSEQITLPVMPNNEVLEYLPTQVVAEYLAAQERPSIDGMVYRSTQSSDGGKNVVLFHKAARVESELIKSWSEATYTSCDERIRNLHSGVYRDEPRAITLRLVPNSARIHFVRGVFINTDRLSLNQVLTPPKR